MFKEQMNKLKSFFAKSKKADNEETEEGKGNKRKIENLIVFLVILIITIIAINVIINKEEDTSPKEESAYKVLADLNTSNDNNTDELEKRLEKILGTMTGVGKVNVLITYTQSSEVVAMYNENSTISHTSESDSSGGTRTVEEQGTNKEIIFTEENGESIPATQTVINPKVEGVIVTAEGADDANIKANIVSAVIAVTGAQAHKVQVFAN